MSDGRLSKIFSSYLSGLTQRKGTHDTSFESMGDKSCCLLVEAWKASMTEDQGESLSTCAQSSEKAVQRVEVQFVSVGDEWWFCRTSAISRRDPSSMHAS